MREVTIEERQSGNVFIREVNLPNIGDSIPQHRHKYDHTMFFMRGQAKVTATTLDGEVSESIVNAPNDVLVGKGILHGVEALSENVLFCCVFPHRDGKGLITTEPVDIRAYY